MNLKPEILGDFEFKVMWLTGLFVFLFSVAYRAPIWYYGPTLVIAESIVFAVASCIQIGIVLYTLQHYYKVNYIPVDQKIAEKISKEEYRE